MLTFIFYILPIIGTIFCSLFYAKNIDRDSSCLFIPRLIRIFFIILCFIPAFGIVTFIAWIVILVCDDTTLKENKLTNFFMNN